jgi:ribonuclease P protein component
MAIRYTLCKDERLKREQYIETLFRSGKAFSAFPLRFIWHFHPKGEAKYPVQAGFSVPKKKFRHAVDRNRIKRLIREAWRLQKHAIYERVPPDMQLHLFLIFTDTSLPDQGTITAAMLKGISKLQVAINQGDPSTPAIL